MGLSRSFSSHAILLGSLGSVVNVDARSLPSDDAASLLRTGMTTQALTKARKPSNMSLVTVFKVLLRSACTRQPRQEGQPDRFDDLPPAQTDRCVTYRLPCQPNVRICLMYIVNCSFACLVPCKNQCECTTSHLLARKRRP